MKKILFALILHFTISFTAYAQTILINSATQGGFESGSGFAANGWTVVNGAQTNRWYCITPGNPATPFAGTNCAYISNTHPAGGSYAYTVNSASVVHFYRDVTIPAGEPYLNLQFRYKGNGESIYDYLRVFSVPTSTTPVAGTQLTIGQIGANYYNLVGSTWTLASINFCGTPGTTIRLVFSWINDNSLGTQPPAAIDNIHLTSSSTAPPCNLGTGVTTVGALPYASGSGTTCGAVNDLTSANTMTCGSSSYLGGEDRVWIFTPTSAGNITINLTSTGSWTGLMLYDGCPLMGSCVSGGAVCCVASATGSSGNKTINFCARAGVTYYLILDVFPSPSCNPYTNLTISAPSGSCIPNEDCVQAITVCSNSSFGGGTSGVGCSQELNTSNQGCLSVEHNSNWYIFSPSTSGTIAFTIAPSGSQDYDFAVWGPYSSGSTTSSVCPPSSAPLRCSYASGLSTFSANGNYNTGLGNGATDNTEGAGGNGWVAPITATAGQVYLLLIDNFTADGAPFNFTWTGTASMSCTVLSFELLSFSGKNLGAKNFLEWTTASEVMTDKYIIERSLDGIFFEQIGFVRAYGTQNTVHTYSFYDDFPAVNRLNYYRLKEVAVDGQYEYSNVIILQQTNFSDILVGNAYPNPGEDNFIIEFSSKNDLMLTIELYDISGKIVLNETINISSGVYQYTLKTINLSKGVYTLKIANEFKELISAQKLMVK